MGQDNALPGFRSQKGKRKDKRKKGQKTSKEKGSIPNEKLNKLKSATPGWDPPKGAQVQRNAKPKSIQVQRNEKPKSIHSIKAQKDVDDIGDAGIMMKWNGDKKILTNLNLKSEERAMVQAEDRLGKLKIPV